MNQDNNKLLRIKKSCKFGKIFSKIFFMICAVGTVISLIVGILMLTMPNKWENEIANAIESESEVTVSANISLFRADFMHMDLGDLRKIGDYKVESSLPFIENRMQQYPYTTTIGLYLLTMALMIGIMAFALSQISDAFRIIEEEETPFSARVIRKLLVTMIIISVILAFTMGMAFGVIGGFVTWAVYSIMDYGRTLQIESDETL